MSKKTKRTACLGGGNAMPKVILSELKKYPIELLAVSAMLDSGGSAGRERELYGTSVAYGDIRRAAYHLSGANYEKREFLNKRLETDEDVSKARKEYPVIEPLASKDPQRLKGHVLSNIICTATDINSPKDGIIIAIEELKNVYEIPEGRDIIPATLDNSELCAELENGQTIKGEANIDISKHDSDTKIKRAFLCPEAKAYSGAIEAIKSSDIVIIGPGDLYSSLAQVLLLEGIPEAINESQAKKIYVCNAINKKGETNGYSVSDFTKIIEGYLGGELDFVLYNNNMPSEERVRLCNEKHPEYVDMVSFEKSLDNSKFIGEDLILSEGLPILDPEKVNKVIKKICKL